MNLQKITTKYNLSFDLDSQYKITRMYKEILDKIIKPQYRKSLSDWQSYAKDSDKKGLQIIDLIYKSKGSKPLAYRLPQQKIMFETQISFLSNKKNVQTLKQAEQKFRLKQMTTSYNFFHGGLSVPKSRTETTIFQFKTLQKMDLARPFTSIAVQFLDNWIELRDNVKYQKFVLSCLRSINSKVQLSDPNTTEMKTQYNWKNDWNLSKPVRIDKAGEQLFAFKPNYSAIQKQRNKEKKMKQKLNELQQTDFAKTMHLYSDFKIK